MSLLGRATAGDLRMRVPLLAALAAASVSSLWVVAPIALAGSLAVGYGVSAMVVPVVAMGMLAILSPLALTVSSNFLIAVVVAACAIVVTAALMTGRVERARTPLVVTALLIYLGMSWIIAVASRGSVSDAGAFLATFALISVPLLVVWVATPSQAGMRTVLLAFVGAAVTLALWDILVKASGAQSMQADAQVAGIDLSRHNVSGLLFVMAGAILAPTLSRNRRGWVPAQFLALSILTVGTAVSLSRSAYVAGLVVLIVLIVLRRRVRLLAYAAAVGALGVALAALIGGGVLDAAAQRIVGSGASSGGVDLSVAVRLDLWSSAWRMFADNPILGVGFLHGAERLPEYWTGSASDYALGLNAVAYVYAHNLPLTLLAQGGILAALLGVGVVTSMVRDALRAPTLEREQMLLVLAAVVSACLFGEPIFNALVAVPFVLMNAATRGVSAADA